MTIERKWCEDDEVERKKMLLFTVPYMIDMFFNLSIIPSRTICNLPAYRLILDSAVSEFFSFLIDILIFFSRAGFFLSSDDVSTIIDILINILFTYTSLGIQKFINDNHVQYVC